MSLFDSSSGDEESTDVSLEMRTSVDLSNDAGDWLERRADIPRVTPDQPSSSRWPLLTPRNPLQSRPRRLPRVSGISDLTPTERGLRIFSVPLPLIELEGSPIPTEALEDETDTQESTDENRDPQPDGSAEIDEDESALAMAIELSLRTQNRYTVNGTNLEELRQAIANSVLEDRVT